MKKFYSILIAFFAILGQSIAQDLPITPSTLDNPVWYRIKNTRAASGTVGPYANAPGLDEQLTLVADDIESDNQIFCFVGDNTDGFIMYNKAFAVEGTEVVPDNADTNKPRVSATKPKDKWIIDLSTAGDGYYGISYKSGTSTTKFWNQDGGGSSTKIGYWTSASADAGSRWSFEKVDLEEYYKTSLLDDIAVAEAAVNNVGELAGQYTADQVASLSTVVASVKGVADDPESTIEQYKEAIAALDEAMVAMDGVMPNLPATDGQFYAIVSTMKWKDGKTKAINDTEGLLKWADYSDGTPASAIWSFEKNDDGQFAAKNAVTNKYAGEVKTSANIATVDAPAYYILTFNQYKLDWAISYTATTGTTSYHCGSHSDGAGTTGNVVGWNTTADASRWTFVEVEISKEPLEKAINAAEEALLNAPEEGAETWNQIKGSKNTLLEAIYPARVIYEGPTVPMNVILDATNALEEATATFQDSYVKPTAFEPASGSVFVIKRTADSQTLNKFGDQTWKEHKATFDPVGTIYDFGTGGDNLGVYTAKSANFTVIKSAEGQYRVKYTGVENGADYEGWVRLTGSGFIKPTNYGGGDSYFVFTTNTSDEISILQYGGTSYADATAESTTLSTTTDYRASFKFKFEQVKVSAPLEIAIKAADDFYATAEANGKTFGYTADNYATAGAAIAKAKETLTNYANLTIEEIDAAAKELDKAMADFKATRIEPDAFVPEDGSIFVLERASDGLRLNKTGDQTWKEHKVSFEPAGKFVNLEGTSTDFPAGQFVVAPTAFKFVDGENYDFLKEMTVDYFFRLNGFLKVGDTQTDGRLVLTSNTDGNIRIGQYNSKNYSNATAEQLASTEGAEAGYLYKFVKIQDALTADIAAAKELAEKDAANEAQEAAKPALKEAIAAAEAVAGEIAVRAAAGTATQQEYYDAWQAISGAIVDYNVSANVLDEGKIAFSNGVEYWFTISAGEDFITNDVDNTAVITALRAKAVLLNQLWKLEGTMSQANVVSYTGEYLALTTDGGVELVADQADATNWVVFENPDNTYTLRSAVSPFETLTFGTHTRFTYTQETTSTLLGLIADYAQSTLDMSKEGVIEGTYLAADRKKLADEIAVVEGFLNAKPLPAVSAIAPAYSKLLAAVDTYTQSEISGILFSTEDAPVWFYLGVQTDDARNDLLLTATDADPLFVSPAEYTTAQMWRVEGDAAGAKLINRATGKVVTVNEAYEGEGSDLKQQEAYASSEVEFSEATWTVAPKVVETGKHYTFTAVVNANDYEMSAEAVAADKVYFQIVGTDASVEWKFYSAIQDESLIIDSVATELNREIEAADKLYNETKEGFLAGQYLPETRLTFIEVITAAKEVAESGKIDAVAVTDAYNALVAAVEAYKAAIVSDIIFSTEAAPVWYYISSNFSIYEGLYMTSNFDEPVNGSAINVYDMTQMWRFDGTKEAAYMINMHSGDTLSITPDYVNNVASIPQEDQDLFTNGAAAPAVWTITTVSENVYVFESSIDTEQYYTISILPATANNEMYGTKHTHTNQSTWLLTAPENQTASKNEMILAQKEILRNLIADANALYSATKVGTEPFQVPSKAYLDEFSTKIGSANTVLNYDNDRFIANNTGVNAYNRLINAIADFKAAMNPPAEFRDLITYAEKLITAAGDDEKYAADVVILQAEVDEAKEVDATATSMEEITPAQEKLQAAVDAFGTKYPELVLEVGVDNPTLSAVNVYTSGRSIVVEGAEGIITVTTLGGTSYSVAAEGTTTTINVDAAGTYIITANGTSVKIAVR